MRRAIFAIMMLAAVTAWGIDQSMSHVASGLFCHRQIRLQRSSPDADRHTALTVDTNDAKVPQSGIPAKAGKEVFFPGENFEGRSPAPYGAGRSAEDFLAPDGRFDLKAIQASGYQGPLDLKGFNVGTDPHTGEPVLSPSAITKRVEGKGTLDQQVGFNVGTDPRTGEPVLSPANATTVGRAVRRTARQTMMSGSSPPPWRGIATRPTPRTGEPVLLPSANDKIFSHPDDTYWTDRFSCMPGLDGYCYALCVYDGKLIAVGNFEVAGCTLAANIASWDGSSWSPLGSGMNYAVEALAVYDNKLIAGGEFTSAGGVGADYIASWDGSSWSSLGSGTNDWVRPLTVYDGKLIAGGGFVTAAGIGANHIASWDGSSWDTLGSGMNGDVLALTVYDNKLIAGGAFTTAGGVSANHIAYWDGSSWSSLGSGMNGGVYALTVYDNRLIAGGAFTTAGGVSANYIASCCPWSPLGTGMNDYVYALAVYDNKLIAGGYFTTAGGVSANRIASWNGSSWDTLGSGMGGDYPGVGALAVYDNKLIAGGWFTTAGGVSANCIASWNGFSWDSLGSGMNDDVYALAVYGNKLIAGGEFRSAGDVDDANNIAFWDGSFWSPLGSGTDEDVYALTGYDNKLIVGGNFTTAGGRVSAYIAQWTRYTDVVDEDNEWSIPKDFTLKQNYPNPFNPTTTIHYTVHRPRSAVRSPIPTTLKIYNILGQKVRTLVDEPKRAGNYEVIWDGKDDNGSEVASGIYFCRLRAGDHVQAKKMVLIK